MIEKTMLLAAAVAALVAFAAPAAAQANNSVITNSLGEPAEHLTADGVNIAITVPGGVQFRCTTVSLTITLTQNTSGVASGHGTGFAEGNPFLEPSNPKYDAGDCTSTTGQLGHRYTSITASNFMLNSGGTGSATLRYTYDIVWGGVVLAECTVHLGASLEQTASDKLRLVDGTLSSTSGAPCPLGTMTTGEVTLTDELSEEAVID